MFAIERQKEIHDLIRKNGAVTVVELVKRFSVSIETIRRDLLYMEQKKLLYRVHGGAVSSENMNRFSVLDERMTENEERKKELAETAARLISEGDIIVIDSGSTAVFFAEALKEHFDTLTVITHSADVFERLCRHKQFEVILCGGNFLKSENAFWGELTLDMMKNLHANKAVLCPSAVSLKSGICDYQHELYQIQRQILRMSDSVYVLADSSKFEKNALFRLGDMKDDYTYVTDSKLPDRLREVYAENGISILTGEEEAF